MNNQNKGEAMEAKVIKTWRERLPKGAGLSFDYAHVSAMKAEINDLRAALASAQGEIARLGKAKAASACVGCEGTPRGDNNPCAVCGAASMDAIAALRVVQQLSRISMSLAADLVQGVDYTFQGHDYLDRNFVVDRVMQWRSEWDALAPVRIALAERARAAANGKTDREAQP